MSCLFVYYETIKRELNKRLICECRCDERRRVKARRPTPTAYTLMWVDHESSLHLGEKKNPSNSHRP
jgi:hypothetical protein